GCQLLPLAGGRRLHRGQRRTRRASLPWGLEPLSDHGLEPPTLEHLAAPVRRSVRGDRGRRQHVVSDHGPGRRGLLMATTASAAASRPTATGRVTALVLRIWRQDGPGVPGRFEHYEAGGVTADL